MFDTRDEDRETNETRRDETEQTTKQISRKRYRSGMEQEEKSDIALQAFIVHGIGALFILLFRAIYQVGMYSDCDTTQKRQRESASNQAFKEHSFIYLSHFLPFFFLLLYFSVGVLYYIISVQ